MERKTERRGMEIKTRIRSEGASTTVLKSSITTGRRNDKKETERKTTRSKLKGKNKKKRIQRGKNIKTKMRKLKHKNKKKVIRREEKNMKRRGRK